jgi:glutaconate CoA-transferase subunit A
MTALMGLAQAAASIPDGSLLALGGFELNRAPMALVFELLRQKRRGLRIVSLPNPLPLDLLVAGGAVAEA